MAKQTSVWGKMVSGTAGAVVGMKRAGRNVKRDGKIEDARKSVRALTYEVGRLTVRAMDTGSDVSAPVSERYQKIKALREEMRSHEAAKQRTKTECPHCGEKVSAGMRFCGACGEELASE